MVKKTILKKAEEDFKYLLNRNYKRKSALNFIANRYKLREEEKNFLLRKVFSQEEIKERKKKLIPLQKIKGKKVIIDTYNTLITVEAILSGKKGKLVKGEDGFLRDFRGVFSNYKFSKKTEKAVERILEELKKHSPSYVLFILDSQISRSGELAQYIREKIKEVGLKGKAKTKRKADYFLKKNKDKVVITTDTAIVKEVEKVADIGREIYEKIAS